MSTILVYLISGIVLYLELKVIVTLIEEDKSVLNFIRDRKWLSFNNRYKTALCGGLCGLLLPIITAFFGYHLLHVMFSSRGRSARRAIAVFKRIDAMEEAKRKGGLV